QRERAPRHARRQRPPAAAGRRVARPARVPARRLHPQPGREARGLPPPLRHRRIGGDRRRPPRDPRPLRPAPGPCRGLLPRGPAARARRFPERRGNPGARRRGPCYLSRRCVAAHEAARSLFQGRAIPGRRAARAAPVAEAHATRRIAHSRGLGSRAPNNCPLMTVLAAVCLLPSAIQEMSSIRLRSAVLVSIIGITACSGLKDALTAHVDTVARAGGQELTVQRLSQMMAAANAPARKDVALAIANIWVNYQLLGEAASRGDSLTDQKLIDEGMWAQ